MHSDDLWSNTPTSKLRRRRKRPPHHHRTTSQLGHYWILSVSPPRARATLGGKTREKNSRKCIRINGSGGKHELSYHPPQSCTHISASSIPTLICALRCQEELGQTWRRSLQDRHQFPSSPPPSSLPKLSCHCSTLKKAAPSKLLVR